MPSGTGGRYARQCSSASLFRKNFHSNALSGKQTGIAMMISRNAWELRGWRWSVLLVLAAARLFQPPVTRAKDQNRA